MDKVLNKNITSLFDNIIENSYNDENVRQKFFGLEEYINRTFRTSFIKHSIFRILSPSDSKSPTIHQSYLPPFSPQSHQVEFPIP